MDYADKLDMMDDDCDIQGFPLDDGKDTNVHTNADHIRAMSDEELAVFVDCRSASDIICHGEGIGGCFNCTAVADWLKQPWKEQP